MNISTLLQKLPDSSLENELSRYFHRELNDHEVLNLLKPFLLSENFKVRKSALRLVKRVVRSQSALFEVLDMGLNKNNPSEFRGWLDSVYDRLGPKKIVSYLISKVHENSEQVNTAMYQLKAMLLSNDRKVKTRIHELESLLNIYTNNENNSLH